MCFKLVRIHTIKTDDPADLSFHLLHSFFFLYIFDVCKLFCSFLQTFQVITATSSQ